jgi:4,5-dihydroxyphthalate decarboxylase
MANLRLTMACGPYDRTEALRNGTVQIEGVDLTYLPIQSPMDIFGPMLKQSAFDIAEMSLTHCFVLRAQNRFPFVTLPVFPSRMFRHGYIFLNRRSGIGSPKDLENKRIGVQGYQMTAAVWIRGMLRDEHGVSLDGIQWVEGGVNAPRVPEDEVTMLETITPLNRELAGKEKTLSRMLADGEIDALIGALIPSSYGSNSDVVRLFPGYQEMERDYFKRRRIFPIMHALVIRESLCRDYSWLEERVCRACEQAKSVAQKQMRFSASLRYMLPWLLEHLQEIDEIFGGDPWPYGLEPNRPALEAFSRHLFEQHFISEPVAVEKVFAPAAVSTRGA